MYLIVFSGKWLGNAWLMTHIAFPLVCLKCLNPEVLSYLEENSVFSSLQQKLKFHASPPLQSISLPLPAQQPLIRHQVTGATGTSGWLHKQAGANGSKYVFAKCQFPQITEHNPNHELLHAPNLLGLAREVLYSQNYSRLPVIQGVNSRKIH